MPYHAPTLRHLDDQTTGWQRRCMALALLLVSVQLQPLFAAVETSAGPVAQNETGSSVPASDDRLTVSRIHGRAFHIQKKGTYKSLQDGASVRVNQPVKVGPKSRLDLEIRDGGTLELGPAAQLVLQPASRAGREDAEVTGLRLDNGYLRVSLGALPAHARFEVSFGTWLAELKPGEYVFDTRNSESSVCVLSGHMRMTGLPEGSAAPEPDHCLRMTDQAPAQLTLAPKDWADVHKRRALLAVLTEASPRQRDEAPTRSRDHVIASEPSRLAEALMASAPPQASPTKPPAPVLEDPIAPPAVVATMPTGDPPPALGAPPVADVAAASAAEPSMADATARPASRPSGMEVSLVKVSVHPNNEVTSPATPSPIDPLVEADGAARENAPLEWIVNVATHPSLEAAELQAAQLSARNFQTSIRRETVRGRSSYRVVIEGLATEQAANTAVRTLGSEMGLRQAWVFRKH